jgi:hypothetical protein
MPDARIARWRRERNRRRKNAGALRKRLNAVNARVNKLNAAITRRKQKLGGTPGDHAARYLLRFVGQTESPPGSNDSPFLARWRRDFPTLSWMRGQPWCGFACLAAWFHGANKKLPDGVVYTPNIVNWARSGQGFRAVPATHAQAGDLVVFDFDGGGADHVGLALGPAVGGLIPTVEGNTSSSNSGSQSNGGGVFKRSRPVGLIAVVARPK